MQKIGLEKFIDRVTRIAERDTSADPIGWTRENPLWGHCAIIALLVQKTYGGDVIRASLMHIPSLALVRSHYANRLPGGVLLDVTAGQFGPEYPQRMTFALSSREHILSHEATALRYERFYKRYVSRGSVLSKK